MHVAHDTAADEDVLDAAQVRVLVFVEDLDVVELDVEVLVDGLEGAADGDVVLEFEGDGLVGERLEEGEEEHGGWRWFGLESREERECVFQVVVGLATWVL